MRTLFVPLIVVASLVLGGTVFRSEVANAAMQVLQVFITNDSANPVPVQGTVKLGSTPIATANKFGGGGCSAGPCDGNSFFSPPIIVSSIVLTDENGNATFTFNNGGNIDPVTHQYVGGVTAYTVAVAANTTTAIPLYDRIVVNFVAFQCPGACDVRFALLGQTGP